MWPGYISKRYNLHSGVPVKHSEGKTTCQKETRCGVVVTSENKKEKKRGTLFLEVSISGLKLLGEFFFPNVQEKKRQLKLKPSGKCQGTVV